MHKSFLKWAGGKGALLKHVLKQIGTVEGNYIEPFCGSSVVAFNVEAKNKILFDINKDLINIYNQIMIHGLLFIEKARNYFEAEYLNTEAYYKLRKEFNATNNQFKRALLFLYLNKTAFNGLCRYNKSGIFNVPYGKITKAYFPEKELLWFYNNSSYFTYNNCSFEHTFKNVNKKDVIYCDPPYLPLNKTSNFTSYTKNGFSYEQHEKLVHLAKHCGCKVIISNHLTKETEYLYKDADGKLELEATRTISAKSSSRKKVKELLVVYGGDLCQVYKVSMLF